jgi:hypothetical protein
MVSERVGMLFLTNMALSALRKPWRAFEVALGITIMLLAKL